MVQQTTEKVFESLQTIESDAIDACFLGLYIELRQLSNAKG
jgi:hypothetical protein